MNDICLDKQPRSIYKVKLWKSKNDVVVYIFVGPHKQDVKRLLRKVEDKHKLDQSETKKLDEIFGKHYSALLGINDSYGVRFVFESLHRDDTVGIIKKKLLTYLPDVGQDDDIYMWIDRIITTTPMWHSSIAVQLMRGKSRISMGTLKQRMRELLGTRSSREMTREDDADDTDGMALQDVIEVVNSVKMKSLTMPLEFKRVIDGYMQYGFANPFKVLPSEIYRLQDADTIYERGNLLETFVLANNTIHIVKKSTIGDLIQPFFFQSGSANNLDKEVIKNADALCNEYLAQVEKDQSTNAWADKLTMTCFVKFLHLRFNERVFLDNAQGRANVNGGIPLSEVFNRLHSSRTMPFIKHNIGGVTITKHYKLYKEAAATVEQSVLNTWTESTTSGRRIGMGKTEYIMIKGAYGATGSRFLTFLLFPDFRVDVKFTNSKGDDLRFVDIHTKGFDAINAIVQHIREVVPEVQNRFRGIDRSILVHRDSNSKLVNLVTQSRIDISVDNVQLQNLKMFAASMYPYFAIDATNKSESGLLMSYKRIDNFANASNITVFLNRNYDHDDAVLIENLIRIFGISKDAAGTEVSKWRKKSKMSYHQIGQQLYLKPKDYNNITISLTKEKNGYSMLVDGVTDLLYHKRIANLIRFLVLHVRNHSVTSKFLSAADTEAFDKIAYHNSPADPDNEDDEPSLEDALTSSSFTDHVDEDDLDDDVWGFQPVIDDDNDRGEEDDVDVLGIGAEDKKARDKYVLKRLQRADPGRFGHPYSKLCQQVNNRQPIVITQDEKKRIDDMSTRESYVNHVVVGIRPTQGTSSTKVHAAKKNIYICPDVWCPLSKVSMSFEQFEANEGKCPIEGEVPMDFTTKYFNAPGKPEIDPVTNKRMPSSKYQSPRYVGFVGSSQECLPCCFKTNPTEKQISARCDENPDRSDVTIDESQKSAARYILGTQFPLDVDRFGLLPSTVETYFGKMKCGSGSRSTGFVTDTTDCFVRKGIASPSQTQYFLSCMAHVLGKSQSDMLESLRANVNVNMFLSLNGGKMCSQFVDASRTVHDPQEFELFRAWLTDKNTLRTFKFDGALKELLADGTGGKRSKCNTPLLHTGTIRSAKSFTDVHPELRSNILRLYLIYNAFTSFRSYLADPASVKVDEVLLDIFNRKTDWLNPEGFNIVIVEASSEAAYVVCNYNLENVRPHYPYVFLVKQPKYIYEPIVRIRKGEGEGIRQQMVFKSGDHAVLDDIISAYESACGSNIKLKGADGRAIYTYLRAIKKPVRYQVLDYDLMLVGFVLQERADCLFVPLRKQAPILDISVECIYVSDINRFIPEEIDWQSAADTFKELFNLSKDPTYDIEVLYNNTTLGEKQPVAFVNKQGSVIPLRKTDLPQEMYLDNLNIFIGLNMPDPRVLMVKDIETKESVFQAIKAKVLNAFANNEDLAMLLDDDNNIEKLKAQVGRLVSKMVVEHDDTDMGNYGDTTHNMPPCSARKKKSCNGMCTLDENNVCRIKVMPGVLQQFEGRIVDILVTGRDTLAFPLGKPPMHMTDELTFDQDDVLDGTLGRMMERVRNPFAFLDRVLDEVVDKHVQLYPVQRDLFGGDWAPMPSPFSTWFKNFHLNPDRKKTPPDRTLLLQIANALSVIRNYRMTFDEVNMFNVMKNHYIDMQHTNNLATVVAELKDTNGSFAYLSKTQPLRTLDDVFGLMQNKDYWPGNNELEVLANLFQVHIVLLTRKTLKSPSYYRKISSVVNKDDYVFLFWKEEKDETQKRTLRDTYQIVSNKKIPKLVWNLQEVKDILIELGIAPASASSDVIYLGEVS